MKFKYSFILAAALALATLPGYSQTTPPTTNSPNLPLEAPVPTITINGTTIVPIIGQPFTFGGQTVEVVTNGLGGLTVMTWGPNGTNSIGVPHSPSDMINWAQAAVVNNNPANIGYYSTNGEWNFKIGAAYAQNTGQAYGLLGVARYGFIPKAPNLGASVGLLEGTQNGQNGTAAEFAFLEWRHPIGDVAFEAGLGGGRDNTTGNYMGLVKAGIEYRQTAHLGEWVSATYDYEGWGSQTIQNGATINNRSGLLFAAGFNLSF